MPEWSLDANYIVKSVLNILYVGMIVGTIIVIILDNRNPVKTMAWILVLIFLPWVGLIFYYFFGRSTRREKIIGRRSYNRLLKKPVAAYEEQKQINIPEQYERLIRLFWDINSHYLSKATRLIFIPTATPSWLPLSASCTKPRNTSTCNIISLRMMP